MPLSEQALSVVTRPLPQEKIRERPGKGGLVFKYITADLVIKLLNEAFDRQWNTRIVYSQLHNNTAVVGLELQVPDLDGSLITKQQFGSCDITAGMGPGEAFKGAASDALKKAATLLGIGLELYNDDEPAVPSAGPRLPQAVSKPAGPGKPWAPKAPAPPAPAPRPSTVPRPPSPPKAGNPFANGASTPRANVPAPTTPTPPAAPKSNPFASATANNSGPNSTQMNAMVNLAARKGLSQADMITLANITDVQSFEELTHAQAIEVIKAAQL